ncbi:MAG: magnesium-translocating P-type ATPase [Candidatus Roizmanbacteria bacterium]
MQNSTQHDYWRLDEKSTLELVNSKVEGLSEQEVLLRHQLYGLNQIHKRQINTLEILFRQVTSNPLILLLSVATITSYLLGQQVSSFYIAWMIFLSISLGFWNEYSAEKTIDTLLKKISSTALVIREGEKREVFRKEVTIGDIVLISQGSIIPADIRFLETNNLEINESSLTGESQTTHKIVNIITETKVGTHDMKNIGFMGTNVASGSGKGVVIRIGKDTEFGKIAKSTVFIKPMTDFEKGLANFGKLIIQVITVLTIAIFSINALLGHPFVDSLLFALAIAVGLTPELLPVIVTICLSHGAGKIAKKHVVAKQLIAIENLGNIDVLCTDKTGTLTEGRIEVVDYTDIKGNRSEDVLKKSLLCNSAIVHHKVIGDGIDTALWEYALKHKIKPCAHAKLKDEPFDYTRKLMYSVVEEGDEVEIVLKGAPEAVIASCHEGHDKKAIHDTFVKLSNEGYRLIGIATKKVDKKDLYHWQDIHEMHFLGFISFLDVPKKSTLEALQQLAKLHVEVKIITGDSDIITRKICSEVGMKVEGVLIGNEIHEMTDEELKSKVNGTTVFARMDPEQKLRVIVMLKANGHTVGYMGDGINDIPSLRNADVGISVNTAVDVAKDAASIVLLQKSLTVITNGIIEGRKTFSNTIKYILMATSSNFGNMFSAAGASFFLPFLPMTPVQILLNNGLYDISQITIPSDNVDPESLIKPRHWDIDFIKNYMLFFGPLSSLYDFLTFGVMMYMFHANAKLFQTGWFIESLLTQVLIVFVIRTSRSPFYKSAPGKWLFFTCITVCLTAIILPFTPIGQSLGFVPPPIEYFVVLVILVSTYLLLVEYVKNKFLKKYSL